MSHHTFDPYKLIVRDLLFEKSDGHCWYCGLTLDIEGDWIIEHVRPASKGWTTVMHNLVPACRSCNSIKSNHDLETFRSRAARKLLGIPRLSQEQRDWLVAQGYPDPHDINDAPRFWFEREGLA